MRKIPQWEFDFYALSLPRGHDFGEQPPIAAWAGSDGQGCGIVTHNTVKEKFRIIVMRRRLDSVWSITRQESGFASIDAAAEALKPHLAASPAYCRSSWQSAVHHLRRIFLLYRSERPQMAR
ncbi:MAG: hypothetical protein JNL61_10950 [Rhizobiaceae bacterium]|nr:hypothetical protein [Rhizobiaceae bacterium]